MSSGTVPFNFPPESFMPIGGLITATSIGNTQPMPLTVFFTAPTSGLYGVFGLYHVLSTDGVGTATLTLNVPHQRPQILTPNPVNNDSQLLLSPVWFERGQSATISIGFTGVTGTKYNVYLVVRRLF